MPRQSFFSFVWVVVLFFFLTACTIPLRTVVRGPQQTTAVPPDFDPEKHVLLVAALQRFDRPEEVDEKSTRKLEKALAKFFPFRYQVVAKKDIFENLVRFSDTAVYRYALVGQRKVVEDPWMLEGEWEEGISFTPGFRRTYIDFAFYNRVDRVQYPSNGKGASVINLSVVNLATAVNNAMAIRPEGRPIAGAAMTVKKAASKAR